MSEFQLFSRAVEKRFAEIAGGELYTVDVPDIFDAYLSFYPDGSNPIYRERTEHDCSCCRHFVRNIGAVVAIGANGRIRTVWDDLDAPEPYATVADRMADLVSNAPIQSIFRTTEGKYGLASNDEMIDGSLRRYHHFVADVPMKQRSSTPAADRGVINTNLGVFRRGLEELKSPAFDDVLDLIEQNGLYRGAEFKGLLQAFRELHGAYPREADESAKAKFLWSNVSNSAALFRNTVIGTLVTDLSDGVDLEAAVRSFEQKVAPMNYKRPTALITPKMVEQGVAKLRELGLESAVDRRFAKITDVSVNNVLFVDNSVKSQMKGGLEGLLSDSVKREPIDLQHAGDISMDDFLAHVLPNAASIDVLVETKHLANFMSLTAPVDPEAGNLFKWNNGFAWSYDGDAADSIKARVKRAGGNVEATLRVSLAWFNTDDLDLHVTDPAGRHIYFGNKAGVLDVDMNNGFGQLARDAVENCAWQGTLKDGTYTVWVENYRKRETADVGFALELEYGGQVAQYQFEQAVPPVGRVPCLALRVSNGEMIHVTAGRNLKQGSASQEKWGVRTEALVPVDTLMASPNHWDGQEIGNKHWFFVLKGCRNPDSTRGIYNEFLRADLEPHRKVFEVLGNKTKCPAAAEQLSGVGFSSTRGDRVKVVVKGDRLNKAFNIQF